MKIFFCYFAASPDEWECGAIIKSWRAADEEIKRVTRPNSSTSSRTSGISFKARPLQFLSLSEDSARIISASNSRLATLLLGRLTETHLPRESQIGNSFRRATRFVPCGSEFRLDFGKGGAASLRRSCQAARAKLICSRLGAAGLRACVSNLGRFPAD
jgi:hypothetical protein